MNWKIIFQLSLFGLIMAIGTVFLIPMMIEPIFWLAIFVVSAIVIVRACADKYFLHGFFVALLNCVWLTVAQVGFYGIYMANHPEMSKWPDIIANHPRLSAVLRDICIGVVMGLVLGLLTFIVSKLISKKATTAPGVNKGFNRK